MTSYPREAGHRRWPTGDPLAIISVQGTVTGWSARARQLLGYYPSEVVGHSASELLIAREFPKAAGLFLIEARAWSGTAALRHRDGHRVDMDLRLHPSLGDDGAPQAFVVTATLGTPESEANHDRLMVQWAFAQSSVALSTYSSPPRAGPARAQPSPTVQMAWPAPAGGAKATAAQPGASAGKRRGVEAHSAQYSDILGPGRADEAFSQCVRRVAQGGEPIRYERLAPDVRSAHRRAWTIELWPVRNPDTGEVAGVGAAAFDSSEQFATRQRLALLSEAGTRIGTTSSVTRTAQQLADLAVPRFADSASVDLLDAVTRGKEAPPGPAAPMMLRRVAHQSTDGISSGAMTGNVCSYPPFSPPARALASGRAVLCGTDDPDFTEWVAAGVGRSARFEEYGFHSLLATPLQARGVTLGVAVFARAAGSEAYGHDDLILAEGLASRAAVSVDTARRFSQERAKALSFQLSLLPRHLPKQAAIEVAHRYLPIGRGAKVGGDWFDVVPLSGTRVALVVGDVVGHGIPASAAMGRLRTAVRTLAAVDLPPDELLTQLDELVIQLTSSTDALAQNEPDAAEIGATCLYAVYDPVSRVCNVASAGHLPPIVLLPDGTVEVVRLTPGPPLGIGGVPFESTELELPEGSLLSLYTDGLVEVRGHDLGLGLERLCTALAAAVPSLDVSCDIILKAMLPESPADDVALLLARTRALHTDQVAAWSLPADPEVVAEARAQVSRQLSAWGLADAAYATELVVSELVTNAIRYGAPPIGLRLIRDRTLICEVSDTSSAAPHMRRAHTYDEGGRGLQMVAQLTQGWGARHTSTGKTIWAEQRLPVDRP
ncbi:SpoIIE family protein phosphatase [Kitasatospora sp. NPDC058406]|uniref:ATP-binding SpoIIE family protein phosphatase n=1 Tax=Kitasatospora sp. NPDC058406 TaxID=3346483 RepID=UPI003656BD36